jgi:hypothetical protein
MESTKEYRKNNSNLMILLCGFQRVVNHILGGSLGNGFNFINYRLCCLIIQYG